jgi:hypothetical protein
MKTTNLQIILVFEQHSGLELIEKKNKSFMLKLTANNFD